VTHPLITLARAANYDLTSAKAKLSELERQLAALNLQPEKRHACPDCGLTFRSAFRLTEHAYTSHDGPEPEHWHDAEERSLKEDEWTTSRATRSTKPRQNSRSESASGTATATRSSSPLEAATQRTSSANDAVNDGLSHQPTEEGGVAPLGEVASDRWVQALPVLAHHRGCDGLRGGC
jgi:hypothetical protein